MAQQFPNPGSPYIPPTQQQAPAYGVPPVENPGKTLGIVGLVLAFIISPVGLVVSIVGLMKSKKANMSNGIAVAGIVISAISVIAGVLISVMLVGAATTLVAQCADLGPGSHVVNGVTITCGG
jgi:hypothetical protein